MEKRDNDISLSDVAQFAISLQAEVVQGKHVPTEIGMVARSMALMAESVGQSLNRTLDAIGAPRFDSRHV